MSREIKFRVWDATLKRLFYPKAPLYVTGSDWPHVAGRMDFKGVWPTTDAREETDLPSMLEQYTGLKDRDGREIYEGDILRTEGHYDIVYHEDKDPDEFENGWRHWQVVWFSGTIDVNAEEYADIRTGFAVQQIDTSGDKEYLESRPKGIAPTYEFTHYGGNGGVCTNECVVIGNIHENPELLKTTII